MGLQLVTKHSSAREFLVWHLFLFINFFPRQCVLKMQLWMISPSGEFIFHHISDKNEHTIVRVFLSLINSLSLVLNTVLSASVRPLVVYDIVERLDVYFVLYRFWLWMDCEFYPASGVLVLFKYDFGTCFMTHPSF